METFDESTEVLLVIGNNRVVMPLALALRVAGDVNSCPIIDSTWIDRETLYYVGGAREDAAQIRPITAKMRMEWAATQRTMDKEKEKRA